MRSHTHLLWFFLLFVEASMVEADPTRVTRSLAVAVVNHLKITTVVYATFRGEEIILRDLLESKVRHGTGTVRYRSVL